MRFFAATAPLMAVLALAGSAMAQPSSVVVSISPDFAAEAAKLGQRDIDQQIAELTQTIERTLTERNALEGAQINLTIKDLKPNRPTMQQVSEKPGLDPMRSISIGGANIEGTVTTASGEVHPVKYDYYSSSLRDVVGVTTWYDAQRAYRGLASNLARGHYVRR